MGLQGRSASTVPPAMLVPVAGGGDVGFAGGGFRGAGGGGAGRAGGADSEISSGGPGVHDALTLAKFCEASGDARAACPDGPSMHVPQRRCAFFFSCAPLKLCVGNSRSHALHTGILKARPYGYGYNATGLCEVDQLSAMWNVAL